MSEHEVTNWEIGLLEFLRESRKAYWNRQYTKALHYKSLATRHLDTVNDDDNSETARRG